MKPQNQRFESNYPLDTDQISEWVEQFNRDGFLFLEDMLKEEHIAQLKADLDWSLAHFTSRDKDPNGKLSPQSAKASNRLCHRMFEHSQANLNLFDLEPIVSFAEALVAANCHVIHNNSFITPPAAVSPPGIRTIPHIMLSPMESRPQMSTFPYSYSPAIIISRMSQKSNTAAQKSYQAHISLAQTHARFSILMHGENGRTKSITTSAKPAA